MQERLPMTQLMDTPSLLTIGQLDTIIASVLVVLTLIGMAQVVYWSFAKNERAISISHSLAVIYSNKWTQLVTVVMMVPMLLICVGFQLYNSAHVVNANLLIALTFANAIRMDWFGYRTFLLRKNQVS